MAKPIQAIIFDCFGVLIGRGFDETYSMAGGDPARDRTFITDILERANRGNISQKGFHDAITNKLHISLKQYHEAAQRAEQPNEELLRYIEVLHGAYKTAILSNANIGVVEHKIGAHWIDNVFDTVIVSAELGMTKPELGMYEVAAEKLGVTPEACVFIDDHENYCNGAHQAGMQAILYRDFKQMKRQLQQLLSAPSE